MQRTSKPLGAYLLRWFQRTPVHTFFMCPLIVIAFELVLNRGGPTVVPWGILLLAWFICNIFSWGITGCRVQAERPAWTPCLSESSRRAHMAKRRDP